MDTTPFLPHRKADQANFQELSANHSIVIIAHRLSTVIEADEIPCPGPGGDRRTRQTQ
ncbi:MAG: hypothetical protein K0R76_48 [Alphaproteobacteria bacterium]|nr:hypothetical protein [Alphaproteobacteria bacterium]